MMAVALQMLMRDRTKFISIVVGVAFSVMLITEQGSIFSGLVRRSGAVILDTHGVDLWVFDKAVKNIDDLRALKDTDLYRVRAVEGVDWAVRWFKGQARAKRLDGRFENVLVIGVDDATLVGGPSYMVEGDVTALVRRDSAIIDSAGAKKMGGVKVGEELTFNDHRAVIVGSCEATRNFQSLPIVYTRYTQAIQFVPTERNTLSAVLVKVKPGRNIADVAAAITKETGLAAVTPDGFRQMTLDYLFKFTGIVINFGTTVLLGFLVGAAVAGQTFYNFALENLRHFGALKAMGASNGVLSRMIILQALVVAVLGYGVGVGLAAIPSLFTGPNGQLPFYPSMKLLAGSGAAVTVIAVFAGVIALRKVRKVEPAIVFR